MRKAKSGRLLDNRTYDEYPTRRVSAVPEKSQCAAFAEVLLQGLDDLAQRASLVRLES